MTAKNIPVLLITGYLGSGKTTLLNRILNNKRGIKFAVIVNDIGEVNIDADLIQKGGIVSQKDDNLVALQNGCICCTLQTDLINQLNDITATGRFDYIVIEASGICEPEPIARTICSMPFMPEQQGKPSPRLDCICSIVDSLRLRDELECGDALTRPHDEEDIENLIIEQIEFCDMILLNKAAEISASEMAKVRQVVRAIQPKARILECNYADVDLDQLLYTGMFGYDKAATSAAWVRELDRPLDEIEAEEKAHHDHHHDHEHDHDHEHHHDHDAHHSHDSHHSHHSHSHDHDGHAHGEEYGIETFVYYRRKPFDLSKFDRFAGQNWPKNIIRSKGVVYFKQNPDMSYLFEQAGRQKRVTEAGQWFATAPADELESYMLSEPGLARDWDPVYGDRMQKLVIIGQHLDIPALTAQLDTLLAN